MTALSPSTRVARRRGSRLGYETLQCQALWRWRNMQIAVVPDLAKLFHIPNEGRRTYAQASVLRSVGLVAGVWDYLLACPRHYGGGLRAGLWLEMKSPGKGLEEEQQWWGTLMLGSGYAMKVAYNWIDARDAIIDYLQPALSAENAKWAQ